MAREANWLKSTCGGLALGIAGTLAVGAQQTGGSKNDVGGAAAPAPARVTQYLVVSQNTAHELATAVKLKLDEGWEPLGGVASDRNWVFQALVKREP